MVKFITIVALLFILINHANAAEDGDLLTITGTQTANGYPVLTSTSALDANNNQYMAISKYLASQSGGGVTLMGSAVTDVGVVSGTSYVWTMTNGLPNSTVSGTNVAAYYFGAAASGTTNACTVGITHTGTSGVICTSNTGVVITVDINVVEPTLVFNTNGGFSPGDTAVTLFENQQAAIPYGLGATVNPTMGNLYVYWEDSGNVKGCPYEYIYTIANPPNSGASGTDMEIYERATDQEQYYAEGAVFFTTTYTSTGVYGPYDPSATVNGAWCATTVNPPANPTVYAFDAPGTEEGADVYLNSSENKLVSTITLSSWPLFQDPKHRHTNADAASTTHVFTVTCVYTGSAGAPSYSWTCNY